MVSSSLVIILHSFTLFGTGLLSVALADLQLRGPPALRCVYTTPGLCPKAKAGLLPTVTNAASLLLLLSPQVNNMPMMALVNPVYDCLFQLAQPESLSREEEVDCLVLQLHRVGEQLEKMNGQRMDELFILIRDGFLLPIDLSSLARLLLLEIIEFRAAGWKTTSAAHKYYYSEVSD